MIATPRTLPIIAAVIAALLCVAVAIWAWTMKRELSPSGGLYFPWRQEIEVPQFAQADPRWRAARLGPAPSTLGAEGCAVASAAMVLGSYGVDTDPGRLNAYLTENGGYTSRGWMYWEKAAELASGGIGNTYEDLPSYWLIDRNLLAGNPVIVRLRYPNGVTHFVVIVGKKGLDYLIRDPGAGGRKGVYPLREFGSRIEALRFYHGLPKRG